MTLEPVIKGWGTQANMVCSKDDLGCGPAILPRPHASRTRAERRVASGLSGQAAGALKFAQKCCMDSVQQHPHACSQRGEIESIEAGAERETTRR